MVDKKNELVKVEDLQIHVPEKRRAGVYANLSSINASDHEVTIDFVFVHPHDNPKGTLVSRVVLAKDHAMGLSQSLKAVDR